MVSQIGDLISYERKHEGIKINLKNAFLEISFSQSNILRIILSLVEDPEILNYPLCRDYESGMPDVKLTEEAEALFLSTSDLKVKINKNPCRIDIYNAFSELLWQDEPGLGTCFAGQKIIAHKVLHEKERFIGLGEKTGNLDRRGSSFVNWNNDYFDYPIKGDPLYSSIPFFIGLNQEKKYGVYLNNCSKSKFNFGASNNRFVSISVDEGPLDIFFFHADNIPALINQYVNITGKPLLPPLWSIGYHQSRWSYFPASEVLNIADCFRQRDIPVDCIHLDIHYMDQFKVFTWHPDRFENPKEMLRQLRLKGIKTVLIIDPGIKKDQDYPVYQEGIADDLFLKYLDGAYYEGKVWPGWCLFPDFTNPKTRNWWSKWIAELINEGVDGFWNDMNEISTEGNDLPEAIIFDFDGRKADTSLARNIYGFQMARSTFEGAKNNLKGKRPFVLTRASFSGVQRFAALWTGDNHATEDHMLLSARMVNSIGLAGISQSGPDVGGFVGNASHSLFARWMSLGAFLPFFRGHSAHNTNGAEPWAFGKDVEEVVRVYIKLRYRLMPYLYSLLYQATLTGIPVNRTLAIEYHIFNEVFDSKYQNQFTFGPFMLIAPVKSTDKISAMWIPPGMWFDFYSNQAYDGPGKILIESPLTRLPVLIKAGAIIPAQSQVYSAEGETDGILYLHIYYGDESTSFVYYEDDGISYEHETGIYYSRKINFDAQSMALNLEEVKGNYKSKFARISLYLHGFSTLTQVKVNNDQAPITRKPFKPLDYKFYEGICEEEVFDEGYLVQIVNFPNLLEKMIIKF